MAMDLKQAINWLESYQWISLRFITADIQKGTGGIVIDVPKCRINRNKPILPQLNKIADDEMNKESVSHKRSPNHNLHFTRNIQFHGNNKIRKVHPILITHINNQEVL